MCAACAASLLLRSSKEPRADAYLLAHAQGYEIPRDFIVEMDPFSKSNHLLTDSGKPARGKLKAK